MWNGLRLVIGELKAGARVNAGNTRYIESKSMEGEKGQVQEEQKKS